MVVLMTGRLLSRMLLALLVAAATTAGPRAVQSTPSPRVVRVVAERFSFSPSEITVAPGETIEIRLRSEDTSHGFHVLDDRKPIDVAIPERGRGDVAVVFRSDEPGRFEFECSRLCGAGHHFMHGVIVVKAPDTEKRSNQ
jgi:cytochrome c oxidase subunit 2